MIFVTLGTQDKSFERLLKIIEKEVKKGKIKDVLVQAGFTKYETNKFQIFDYVSKDEFDKYMKECDFLITHAGVGSIFTGLKYNKKILAIPRLSKYKEHNNDHQKDILKEFVKCGYIKSFNNLKEFEKALKELPNFKPKKYKSNTNNMIKLISDYIDNN